jgi:hypothetical protein
MDFVFLLQDNLASARRSGFFRVLGFDPRTVWNFDLSPSLLWLSWIPVTVVVLGHYTTEKSSAGLHGPAGPSAAIARTQPR